jgi:hypothetical protein
VAEQTLTDRTGKPAQRMEPRISSAWRISRSRTCLHSRQTGRRGHRRDSRRPHCDLLRHCLSEYEREWFSVVPPASEMRGILSVVDDQRSVPEGDRPACLSPRFRPRSNLAGGRLPLLPATGQYRNTEAVGHFPVFPCRPMQARWSSKQDPRRLNISGLASAESARARMKKSHFTLALERGARSAELKTAALGALSGRP